MGEPREFLQGGLELIGADGAGGRGRGGGADDRRARRGRAAPAPRGSRGRVALPDAAARRSTCREERHLPLLECLSRRDLVGLETRASLGGPRPDRELLVGLPELRGGRRGARARRGRGTRSRACCDLHELLEERGVADRVIFDLGLVRELGYYTGAVFEVYDPAVGFALGGGGRYDDLLGRFGRALPACGVALDVQRVHLAQAAEEALRVSDLTIAVPRGALFDGTLDLLDTLGVDTAEVRSNDRKLLFAEAGIVTMRPERRAHLRRARLGRRRHHRQGRPARAVAPQRLRAARPRLRPLPHGGGRARGRGPDRRRAAPARPGADRDQVPAHRRPPLRGHRPPGRDRGGEGLGRAGAADGPGGRDRRPHGHRHARSRRTGCAWWRRSASARRG